MIRHVLAATVALFATPALGNMYSVHGADPTPHYQVYEGDTLVLLRPMGREVKADGSRDKSFPVWIDRANGRGWAMDGATKLAFVAHDLSKGYVYKPLDAQPAPSSRASANLPPRSPSSARTLYGINLSGGEFSHMGDGQLLPTRADLDAYNAAGFNLFRIPFKATEIDAAPAKLKALASECVRLGVPCIFDRHEYAWPSVADQVDFWIKAAALLGPAAQLDLMNEPRGFTGNGFEQWAADSQAIVTGLRAAGVTNRIWLEWAGSSGTQRFDKGERAPKSCNSAACALAKLPGGTINDPLHLTGLEGHRYFDSNGSGSSSNCSIYVMIDSAAKSAIPFGLPFMLGEYAFGSDDKISDSCRTLSPHIMAEIKASPNLYGVTLWGGAANSGAAFGSYMFRTKPNAASPYVQMTTGR